jgi:hypothetical protein
VKASLGVAQKSMRTEIHAVLESTWFAQDGNLETGPLMDTWPRADAAWRTGKRKPWLRQGDFFGLYVRSLFHELATPVAAGERRRHVREILGEAKANELEDRLVQFAESVPRRYAVDFPLRTALPLGANEVQLGKELTLVTTEVDVQQQGLPSGGLFGVLSSLVPPLAKKTSRTYLRVRTIGFFDGVSEDSAANAALARLRQFMALNIATGAMQPDFQGDTSPALGATVRDLTDTQQLNNDFWIPPAIARMLQRWTISEAAFGSSPRQYANQDPLVRTLRSAPVAEPKRADAIKRNLQSVISVMAAKKADSDNLRTAAEWFFDSQAEDNQTTALLYASIGLEAALDSPDNSTTARLADRLAWLLGRTRKERNALATAYTKFYGVRSSLVHGRERRLDDEGVRQLYWGRSTLKRVIDRDLEQWPLTTPTKSQRKAKAAAASRA